MTESEKYKNFDDIQCLWMKCGAVDYKICDKDFECENCFFDKRMLSELKIKGNLQEEIENMFSIGEHAVSFAHPYYHFSCGLTARNFLKNNYYIGIEPFIAKFIDTRSKIKFCSHDIIVNKGKPMLNISNGWGEIDIISPFNFCFVDKLDINNTSTKDMRWLAVIEAERHEILSSSINRNYYFDKLFNAKLNLINLLRTYESAGATMYDGGTALDKWPDILGKSTYKSLLKKLFS